MLYNNNSYLNSIRAFGNNEGSSALFNQRNSKIIANSYFGISTSFPQGYMNNNAIIMPVKTGSMIATIIKGKTDLNGWATVRQKSSAIFSGVGMLIAFAKTRELTASTMLGSSLLIGRAQVEETLAAVIDAGARPSALDIAQEVWGSMSINYNTVGTMGSKVNSAGDPWNTDVSNYNPNTAGKFLTTLLKIAKFLQVK